MSHRDYGGQAYRNGTWIPERSDAWFTTEGLRSAADTWPGWLIPESRQAGAFHAILGDGPVHVCLTKQSGFSIRLNGALVDELDVCALTNPPIWRCNGETYLNTTAFKTSGLPCVFHVADHWIAVFWAYIDNHYQFVRLDQPDGTTWHGFSGYGVGPGFEDEPLGYSTRQCETWLFELFKAIPVSDASNIDRRGSGRRIH